MSRLRHSFPAFRRSMQMSRCCVHVFVESFNDRYVYDQLARCECSDPLVAHRVVTADELGYENGGKNILLEFFRFLKARRSLVDTFKGKTTVSAFFLDKDVDDFLRTLVRSPHVIYTETYQIENYLFRYGDLCTAAAAAASADSTSLKPHVLPNTTWCRAAAYKWKEWVKLCLFAHTRHINSECHYRRASSPINNVVDGHLDSERYNRLLQQLQDATGLSDEAFHRSFGRLSRKVDKLYEAEHYDRVFKGKWYACFMIATIRKAVGGRRIRKNYLEQTLLSCLQATLSFEDTWAQYFRHSLRNLLRSAGL